jgi:hypothetical protein
MPSAKTITLYIGDTPERNQCFDGEYSILTDNLVQNVNKTPVKTYDFVLIIVEA